jgi:hypothetical protein
VSDDKKPSTDDEKPSAEQPEVEAHGEGVLGLQGIQAQRFGGEEFFGSCSSCVGSLCM